jgi:putative transposase
VKYSCILENEAERSVNMMCDVLNVARSGYYAWKKRKPSARENRDVMLLERIRKIHDKSRQTYGSPRIHAKLQREGERIGRHHVVRLMRSNGISVKIRRKFRATTNSHHKYPVAANILNRNFSPDKIGGPRRVFAGDITYIPTDEGWLYLAVVLDLFARRVLGWSMGSTMVSGLVTDALTMAIARAGMSDGILYHTDRGSQYAGKESTDLLDRVRMTASMSRKANCWDNAVVESWNATLKTELINRYRWKTREEARAATYEFIEVWYNRERLHSTLGYCTPEEFEMLALNQEKG